MLFFIYVHGEYRDIHGNYTRLELATGSSVSIVPKYRLVGRGTGV